MSPRRLEDRDLRSLDRPGLRSIFRPLDPNEKPASGPRGIWLGPPIGNVLLVLMFPLLLALVSVELWLAVPQLVAWLSVLAFIGLYVTGIVLITRRK